MARPTSDHHLRYTRSAASKILAKFQKVCMHLKRSQSEVLEKLMDKWADNQIGKHDIE